MKQYKINATELKDMAQIIRVGDMVELSGVIYTSRDAAHKEIFAILDRGGELPFDLNGAAIYYAGPTETKPGEVIGSIGPTTSGRMDAFSPRLLDLGLAAMIGKGERSQAVIDSIIANKAIYLCAIGGAAADISNSVKKFDVIAFPELGCESIKRLEVENMSLVCTVDCHGGNLFAEGRAAFATV